MIINGIEVDFYSSKTEAEVLALTDSVDGAIYFTSDVHNIYKGTGGAPVLYSGYIKLTERPATPIQNKLYVIGSETSYSLETYIDSGWIILSGTSINKGTQNQIPFMDLTGGDFEYSTNLTWNGAELFVSGDVKTNGKIIFGTNADSELSYEAGELLVNSKINNTRIISTNPTETDDRYSEINIDGSYPTVGVFSNHGVNYAEVEIRGTDGDARAIIGKYDTANGALFLTIHDKLFDFVGDVNGGSAFVVRSVDYAQFLRIVMPTQALTSSAAITMDVKLGNNAKLTLNHAATLTFTNLMDGDSGDIEIIQGATGGTIPVIIPTPKVINGGAGVIELTTGEGSMDIISYRYNGTTLSITRGPNYT
jgi:hypothetical protein